MSIRGISKLMLIALLTAACGGTSYNPNLNVGNTRGSSSGSGSDLFPTNPGDSSADPNNTGDSTNVSTVSPLSFIIEGTGYDTPMEVVVSTRDVLRVAFAPLEANQPIEGTGFIPQYAYLGVYLKAGSREEPTPMLSSGAWFARQMSDIKDYSDQIDDQCDPNDALCRNAVTISIQKPNNDYQCFTFGTFCPYKRVDDNFTWTGVLVVETSDTGPITEEFVLNTGN